MNRIGLPRDGSVQLDLRKLFHPSGGTTLGLGEADLLARFIDRRDEATFEALVARFGPIVLGASAAGSSAAGTMLMILAFCDDN